MSTGRWEVVMDKKKPMSPYESLVESKPPTFFSPLPAERPPGWPPAPPIFSPLPAEWPPGWPPAPPVETIEGYAFTFEAVPDGHPEIVRMVFCPRVISRPLNLFVTDATLRLL